MSEHSATENENKPLWNPIEAKHRRVIGVLMEKSKTTPDAYPMTINSLTVGCNQKSNRHPVMNLTQEKVQEVVDQLRLMGAVTIVQGVGRVEKIRHNAYQWLAIDKFEAAVMCELLLRGEQTFGELRVRASRMEPIGELDQLRTIFECLKNRNLVIELTPPGRGQLVSHNLYPEWELEALRKSVASQGTGEGPRDLDHDAPAVGPSAGTSVGSLAELQQTVKQLAARLAYLEEQLGVHLESTDS